MTAITPTLSRAIVRPVRHLVYTRRAADVGTLPVDTDHSGWTLDNYLRCDEVKLEQGAHGGDAAFSFIPRASAEQAIEVALARYSVDDHVKVVALPVEDELVQQPGDIEVDETVLFEGVLTRHSAKLAADGAGERESVRFFAWPFGRMSDFLSEHLIRGRWLKFLDGESTTSVSGETVTGSIAVIETPSMPAVFNLRGKPNRAGSAQMLAWALVSGASGGAGGELSAYPFTHDDDKDAKFWTLRDAIASLLVMWLYGAYPLTRPRHIDAAPELIEQLLIEPEGASRPDQFQSFDAQLPEVDVHGLGGLSAIQAVCAAAGYEMAIEPVLQFAPHPQPDEEEDSGGGGEGEEEPPAPPVQRRYQLRVWRRYTGRLIDLHLGQRGSSYADPESSLAANDFPRLSILRDATETRNEFYGVGPVFIEARFILKPMWHPSTTWEFGNEDDEITTALQVSPTATQLATHPYFSLHHPGGADFFPPAFRHWGINCTGGSIGYSDAESPYAQSLQPFNFLQALGLADSPLVTEARQAEVQAEGPPRWSQRVRRLLPLRSRLARQAGREYFLEVSEDGLETYQECPVQFRTLRDQCGIQLQVRNFANVNNAVLRGETRNIDPIYSWLTRIRNSLLFFRITAVIEADHAHRYDARRRSTSGTQYARGQLLVSRHETTWVHPDSSFASIEDWEQIDGTTDQEIEETSAAIEEMTQRHRDAHEGARLSVAGNTWRMDLLHTYRLGDRIGGIRGREVSFAVAPGNPERHATVAAITYTLAPAEQQGISLSLTDQRMSGGTK